MSTRTEESRGHVVRPSLRPLPLENGDRLTAAEFERRYDAMPHLRKAELIGGRVYIMSSPGSTDYHGEPHGDVVAWLGYYHAFTPGTQLADNATVRLDDENQPQPDGLLRIRPEFGGRTTTADGYVAGGPELSAEVSASSASYDLHDKLEVFWRHGVQEYVVWRVYDAAIDWFVRGVQVFEPLPPENGVYKSRVFPGLWLDAHAMLAGNMAQVLAVLQQGLATPEHAAFCQQLQQRREAAGQS
jgi:hypothetical protein